MPKRFSDVVGVTSKQLWDEGAFDAFVDIDARFHIDPHLLQQSKIPELQEAYPRFKKHFENVLRLLTQSKRRGDLMYRQARAKLRFPEFRFISLGYSKGKGPSRGSGIGPKMAAQITETAMQIVEAGINDPVIFELVGLIEDNIGADRISDMTARIIVEDLLRFTERVARNLDIRTRPADYSENTYQVPYYFNPKRWGRWQPIVFVPHEIIRPLPIAHDWSDIDLVSVYNARLRAAVNKAIGVTWKDATGKLKKAELKRILLKDPELIRDLIQQYKAKPADQYDFESDPEGGMIWYDIAQEWAEKYPLLLEGVAVVTPDQIHGVVVRICRHFGRLLEHYGQCAFLYNDKKGLRREGYARLLFLGMAETYCRANNLDLSLEAHGGREMVMFKVSRGYKARVYVAVKYSRNSHLVNQYETAVLGYQDHTPTDETIFLVIRTAESRGVLEGLEQLRNQATVEDTLVPELLIVDGRLTPEIYNRFWELGMDSEPIITEYRQDGSLATITKIPNASGEEQSTDEPLGVRAKRLNIHHD